MVGLVRSNERMSSNMSVVHGANAIIRLCVSVNSSETIKGIKLIEKNEANKSKIGLQMDTE